MRQVTASCYSGIFGDGWFDGKRFEVVTKEILAVAGGGNLTHPLHLFNPLSQTLLQPITEPLTLLSAALQLYGELRRRRRFQPIILALARSAFPFPLTSTP